MESGRSHICVVIQLYKQFYISKQQCIFSLWGAWSDCCSGVQTRSRTCAYDPDNFGEPLTEQRDCNIFQTCNTAGARPTQYQCPSVNKCGQNTQCILDNVFLESCICTSGYEFVNNNCQDQGDLSTTGYLRQPISLMYY